MGLIHLTRVFTTYVADTCVRVFEGSHFISSLDPLQIVSNITLAHSHFQFSTIFRHKPLGISANDAPLRAPVAELHRATLIYIPTLALLSYPLSRPFQYP